MSRDFYLKQSFRDDITELLNQIPSNSKEAIYEAFKVVNLKLKETEDQQFQFTLQEDFISKPLNVLLLSTY